MADTHPAASNSSPTATGLWTLKRVDAEALAARIPQLVVAARNVALTLASGWHGRRQSGPGETFWQFRPYNPGEPASGIDWRRSARDDHIYIREYEWQAAHTIWVWPDISPSMDYNSSLSKIRKLDRAIILSFALAHLLGAAGERIGLLGTPRPASGKHVLERFARQITEGLLSDTLDLDASRVKSTHDVVIFSDFLDPVPDVERQMLNFSRTGAACHMVQILDPAEETFPFRGRTRFRDPETGSTFIAGSAQALKEGYQHILKRHHDGLRALSVKGGWPLLIHRTDTPASTPLLTLHQRFSVRRDRSRG